MGEPKGQLVYEFGDFRLDPGQRRLESAGGRRVFVRAKAFDALLYLVERAGQLVEKEALLHAVWPNAVVEENNLNQVISTLRRLLDDDRVSPRFIATVPGRGYQFVAEVRRRPRLPHAIPESGTAPGARLQPPLASPWRRLIYRRPIPTRRRNVTFSSPPPSVSALPVRCLQPTC